MPTIDVKDAAANVVAFQYNGNGRAAAAASRPVALSTEDKAALDAITNAFASTTFFPATQPVSAASLPLPTGAATAAKQDTAAASLTAIDGKLGGTLAVSAAALPLPAGAATNATLAQLVDGLVGTEYETVAAGVTDQVMGASGAVGDLLVQLLIVPGSTGPGAVTIRDGSGGSVITIFPGGASSVATLHPFSVALGLRATSAGWRVSTGANVTAIATGNFT